MNVTINGKPQELAESQNLSELVASFTKYPKGIVTEVNGAIIPSHQWPKTAIKEGDVLELVTFVGGG